MKQFIVLLILLKFSATGYAQSWWYDQFAVGVDSCDFNNSCDLVRIDSGNTGSEWFIANPQKNPFDTGSTGFALFTDTASYYQTNTYSTFTINKYKSQDFQHINMMLSFRHRYETTRGKDGGYIEISYDSGVQWTNLIADSMTPWGPGWNSNSGFNFYHDTDLLFNGSSGFSGSSNGWAECRFAFIRAIPLFSPSQFMIRFVFVSDSIADAKAGWLIDDVKLSALHLPGGIGEDAIPQYTISPNPASAYMQVHFQTPLPTGTIKLYSAEGRLLDTQNIHQQSSVTLYRKPEWNGLCFFTITEPGGKTATGKVIFE